eukprot:1136803-Pelagomonas_calceolata.AAC.6
MKQSSVSGRARLPRSCPAARWAPLVMRDIPCNYTHVPGLSRVICSAVLRTQGVKDPVGVQ